MRAADAMLALPALVLILAARAALPLNLPTTRAAAFLVAVFFVAAYQLVAHRSPAPLIGPSPALER